uniref:ZopL1 n=1 Tax=Diffractella curvata TaxID=2819868 RepID=A0A7R6QY35_9PEZI|nr:ZopL1 [Diffractella curvata]BBU42025.1 putative hypothetical protein [Diffractella curvata]
MYASTRLVLSIFLLGLSIAQTPPGFTPSCDQNLGVTYPNKASIIIPGSRLLASDTAIQPRLSAASDVLKEDGKYLLVMLDPDVQFPKQPTTTILHWMEPGFQYNKTSLALTPVSDPEAESVASYAGPHPPIGQIHRYILLLFWQPEDYRLPKEFKSFIPADIPHRIDFDVVRFVEAAELGKPIAASYFIAEGLRSNMKDELRRVV